MRDLDSSVSRPNLVLWSPWLALAALATATGIRKILSFDYWWHMRTGQLIAETGIVPKVDPYSFSAEGARWIDIHWLFQLLLHKLFELGGHDLVLLTVLALMFALIAILGRIGFRRERGILSVGSLALLVLIGGDRFMPRPEIVSFVLLASVLFLLDRFQHRNDLWIYAIVPIQVLWVNIHGLFALGIVLCVIYLAALLIEGLARRGARLDLLGIRTLLMVTILICLSALVNPNTLDAAIYPFQQLEMIGTSEQRAGGLVTRELAALPSYWPRLTPLAKSFAVSITLVSLSGMLLNRRRLRASDALCWLAFLLLAVLALRNVVLFAIVATPITVRNWNQYLDESSRFRTTPAWAALALSAVLLVITTDLVRGRFSWRMGSLRDPGFGVMEVMHPVAATEWIAKTRPEGPIFHSFVDGGYLIWRLYPDYQVLGDGRLEVFGIERKPELYARSPRDFRLLDKRYRFNLALLNFGQVNFTRLLRHLHHSADWSLVFVDDVSAVFLRKKFDAAVHEIDIDDPELFANTNDEHSVSDAYRAHARIRFFTSLGRPRRAREITRDLLRRYPEFRH